MPKRYVMYVATASFVIAVDVPDDTPADQIDAVARELADDAYSEQHPGSLCHHCAGMYDLGDFEQDDDPGAVWGDDWPGRHGRGSPRRAHSAATRPPNPARPTREVTPVSYINPWRGTDDQADNPDADDRNERARDAYWETGCGADVLATDAALSDADRACCAFGPDVDADGNPTTVAGAIVRAFTDRDQTGRV